MHLLAKRYAQALFQIAIGDNTARLYGEQLEKCIQVIKENRMITNILSNPETELSSKESLLEALFGTGIHKNILNLLVLLIKKNRLSLLEDILINYKKELQHYTRTLDVVLVSAFPPEESEISHIKEKLKQKYHASDVYLTYKIDQNLIGGFKLIIGNEIIDNSIKKMMVKMKHDLLSR